MSQELEAKLREEFGNGTKARAALLLGRNTAEAVVANVLGVSPALISEYKQDDRFLQRVTELKVEATMAASIRDDKINKLEDEALDKMSEVMNFITKPNEVLATLKVLNGLQRRGTVDTMPQQDESNTVRLELPKHITSGEIHLQFNTNKEVVSANGRDMMTMSASQVAKLVEERDAKLIEGTKNENSGNDKAYAENDS